MEWIEEFKGLGLKNRLENRRVLASIFVALSGLLLYLDKVFLLLNIEGSNTFGFSNYSNFIWAFTQSIAPVIMIIGFQFKPYLLSFLIPIYCYAVQIVWIFQPQFYFDEIYLQIYAIGSCLSFLLLMYLIKKIALWHNHQTTLKKEFQQEAQEILHILKAKTVSEN
ncbi:hypothetical protein [uncultured Maribacter sp.]|uniref:hypothetical protein n=1 Tax=uncultured Maribacter sp. TaxID=431308 RepID=UPI0026324552|nr:hypothetical protein [uncultured Maribacter sp.]